MTTRWVLLLRGVNVGGAGRMPMADLRSCLTDAGFLAVRTHIQSGNVVLDADGTPDGAAVRTAAADAIDRAFSFNPPIHVLAVSELDRIIAANPYTTEADADPKSVHYFFTSEAATDDDLAGLREVALSDEAFTTGAGVVYLLAPGGIGRSKLAQALPKRMGGDVTARNHRSVLAITALASS